MTDPTANPRPVSPFTVLFLLALFAAFVFVGRNFYSPSPAAPQASPTENVPEEMAWRSNSASRRTFLNEVRADEAKQAATYAWIDQQAGVVRLPIERAMELTARDFAAKPQRKQTRDLPSPSGSGAKF